MKEREYVRRTSDNDSDTSVLEGKGWSVVGGTMNHSVRQSEPGARVLRDGILIRVTHITGLFLWGDAIPDGIGSWLDHGLVTMAGPALWLAAMPWMHAQQGSRELGPLLHASMLVIHVKRKKTHHIWTYKCLATISQNSSDLVWVSHPGNNNFPVNAKTQCQVEKVLATPRSRAWKYELYRPHTAFLRTRNT